MRPDIPLRDFKDLSETSPSAPSFPAGRSAITSTCTVETPEEIAVNPDAGFTLVLNLPEDALPYLLPSRYCESDKFLKMATSIAGKAKPGYQQAEAIRAWIHRKLKYKYGSSTESTPAMDTARKRAGVRRDFSHLAIALCRALRIPARIVVGYLHLLDPMDLHALVRGVRRRALVYVRRDARSASRQPHCDRLRPGRRRRRSNERIWPGRTKLMSVWVRPAEV